MPKILSQSQIDQFREQGFLAPIRIMSSAEALDYRHRLEHFEASTGGPLHGDLRHKSHLLFTWLANLVRNPRLLDAMQRIIDAGKRRGVAVGPHVGSAEAVEVWANRGARRTSLTRRATGTSARCLAGVEAALMLLLAIGGRRGSALRMLAAVCGVYVVSDVLGALWPRQRPFARLSEVEALVRHDAGRSFPSRHVASGLALAAIGGRAHPRLGLLMSLVAWLLGLSRVAAGLHYRRRTGHGVYLDLSQVESAIWTLAHASRFAANSSTNSSRPFSGIIRAITPITRAWLLLSPRNPYARGQVGVAQPASPRRAHQSS